MKKKLQRIVIAMSIQIFRGVIIACLLASTLLANETNAQHKSIREVFISLDMEEATLTEAFNAIEAKAGFKFIYSGKSHSLMKDTRITIKADNKSVAFILKKIAADTKLTFQQNDGMIGVGVSGKDLATPPTSPEKSNLEQIITGKVTDEAGEPLPGASVLVKNTSIGVIADADGNYRLAAPDEATVLIFSYVGHIRQEVPINGRAVIDITLLPDVTTLGEVVVSTGYWETKEKLNPGNIAKVSAKEIEQQPIATPLQALSGRMAGVNVTQRTGMPGGGIDIQIRGRNSLQSDGNNPLYVVDGIPIPSTTLLGRAGQSVFNSNVLPVNNINPADIESIEVLKDADATAIYGSRGGNGVVLITTKSGKPGKTTFNINHYSGVGEVSEKLDLLNTEQYREMLFEGLANDGFDPVPDFLKPFFPILFAWDSTRYTDWQKELIGGTANFTNTQLSVSGGNANTQFLLSGTYYRQTTVFPGDFAMNRGSGLFNLNHTSIDQKFIAAFKVNFVAENNNLPNVDPTLSAVTLPPNAPKVVDSLGNLNFENNTFNNNPFARLTRPYESKTRNLIANTTLSYNIIPDFTLKTNLGYNYMTVDELSLFPIRSRNPSTNPTGSATFGNGKTEAWSIEPQIEYKKELGPGELSVLIGATFQSTTLEGESILASGYTSDGLLRNVNAAADVSVVDPSFSEYNYNALFGRVNYNWKSKFIVNITGRRDGSSRFGPGNQFGNFGAVGAAWIFSNEDFIKNSMPFLSFGKLRASFGTTGSDQIGNYEFLETHKATQFPYLGTSGLIPVRLPNDEFGWETNKKIEGGIELGLIEDRIFLTTSYYRNRSSSQLVGIPLAATTGFPVVQSNFPATVQNTGWEFELNTRNIKTHDFQWSTSANLTIPRNELVEFPQIEGSTFANRFTVGQSIFNRRGFLFIGVDPETGLYSFEDLNEDDVISSPEDLQPTKDIVQEYFGGIANSFSYNGFQLDFLFQFVKQTGIDYTASFGQPGTSGNQPTIVLNRWQQAGDITDIQKFAFGFDGNSNQAFQDFTFRGSASVVDASFIRLQNVSISYSFSSAITEKLKIENLRLYFQGMNLLTITDYLGLDPETQNSQNLPPLRVLTAGININF